MLDLSAIPVVDNHCHPILRRQKLDALEFRRYFSEATAHGFAEKHVPQSVYYLWLLRQLARLHDCEADEAGILAVRNRLEIQDLLQTYWQAAKLETLMIDEGYPDATICYQPDELEQLSGCRVVKMLRLENLMQELIMACSDFDELLERYRERLKQIREQGYVALKSIVAYRTGLGIGWWRKDQAAQGFEAERREASVYGRSRIVHKPLLDYLLLIALQSATEQEVPVQFHTGYGDNSTDLRLGNPLHLRPLLQHPDFRTLSIVLLHECYPFTQSGAYLAAVYPQVYLDLSYMIPFVEKLEMLAFTRQALSVAPASKLLYSSDGIYVPEMHWAGAVRGRAVLQQVLTEMIEADELDERQALQLAHAILRDNAIQLYRL